MFFKPFYLRNGTTLLALLWKFQYVISMIFLYKNKGLVQLQFYKLYFIQLSSLGSLDFSSQPRCNNENQTNPTAWNNLEKKKWTKYIWTMFSGVAHQAAEDSDPWESKSKWGEPYDCPSLLPGVSRLEYREEEPRRSLMDFLN